MTLVEQGVLYSIISRDPFQTQPFCDLQSKALLNLPVPHSAPILLRTDLLHQPCTTALTALCSSICYLPLLPCRFGEKTSLVYPAATAAGQKSTSWECCESRAEVDDKAEQQDCCCEGKKSGAGQVCLSPLHGESGGQRWALRLCYFMPSS